MDQDKIEAMKGQIEEIEKLLEMEETIQAKSKIHDMFGDFGKTFYGKMPIEDIEEHIDMRETHIAMCKIIMLADAMFQASVTVS